MNLVPFGSVCDLQNGRAFKPSEWEDVGTPIVRIQNLNDETKPFNYCNFEVEQRFHIHSGDLLFSWSGTPGTSFGAFFWNRGKAFLNQHIFRVDIHEKIVDKNYLRHAINSKLNHIIDQAHGGVGLKHITKDKLEAVEIYLPTLPEQKRIAAILDKADSLRRKNQQAIQLADKFLRAVFLDMFGDPVTNPKGWRKGKITSLTEVITGYAFKSSEFVADNDDSVRLCRGANTLTGYFDWEDTVFFPKQKISGLEHYLINQGDIILAMDRPWISSGLKVCIADRFDRETYLVQRVARLRPRRPFYSHFIYSCVQSKSFELHCNPTETTVPHISPVELKDFDVMLPDEVELKRFNEIAQRVRSLYIKLDKSSYKADISFNALSQKAFAGEL